MVGTNEQKIAHLSFHSPNTAWILFELVWAIDQRWLWCAADSQARSQISYCRPFISSLRLSLWLDLLCEQVAIGERLIDSGQSDVALSSHKLTTSSDESHWMHNKCTKQPIPLRRIQSRRILCGSVPGPIHVTHDFIHISWSIYRLHGLCLPTTNYIQQL